jgi:cytochrome P450
MPVKDTPPGRRGIWPGQTLVAFRRDPLRFLSELSIRYGPVASFRIGPQLLVLLNDPESIRDVLVTNQRLFKKGRGLERTKPLLGDGLLTSERDVHLRQRRLAQPAFHRERIAGYAQTMVADAMAMRDTWTDGAAVDLSTDMTALTLGIVGRTLFGSDVVGETTAIRDAMAEALRAFEIATLPYFEVFDHLPVPWMRRLRRAKTTLDAIVYRLIAERRRDGVDRGDLLSMLLLARDTEGDGSGMTDTQLRDEILTIFLAGHETTANALAWAAYALSRHPDVDAALFVEVSAIGIPSVDDLPRLTYTRAVVSEVLRLYPPAWIIGRRTIAEYRVGGYELPVGTLVFVSPWVTQRDPRYWDEPERFAPQRWLEHAPGKFAYFPFGGGPRICIGESFAWTELILVLATLVQQWRFVAAHDRPVVPKPVITLRPRHGMPMVICRRPAR